MAHGQWSEVEARGVLEAWRRSGLSVERFAKQRGFVPQRLRWWKVKFAAAEKEVAVSAVSAVSAAPALLPVRLASDSAKRGEPVTVCRRSPRSAGG